MYESGPPTIHNPWSYFKALYRELKKRAAQAAYDACGLPRPMRRAAMKQGDKFSARLDRAIRQRRQRTGGRR